MKNIEVKLTTIQMSQFISEHDITSVYPYVEVALHIFLCTKIYIFNFFLILISILLNYTYFYNFYQFYYILI